MNTIINPPKGDIVSVIAKECANVLHVVNLMEDNAYYTPIAAVLQWVQQNLSPLIPLESNCPTGHLHLAAANWMKVTSDPWILPLENYL